MDLSAITSDPTVMKIGEDLLIEGGTKLAVSTAGTLAKKKNKLKQ